jgi:hypothetical protein
VPRRHPKAERLGKTALFRPSVRPLIWSSFRIYQLNLAEYRGNNFFQFASSVAIVSHISFATAESIAEYKALCREWDAARIKFRVAAAAQIQEENSAVGSAMKSRILHFGKHTR